MSLVLRRTALFVAIVLIWALFAAATRAATREIVALPGFAPGTIVVRTAERRLYFSLDGYHALRFPVGVSKAGMQWSGVTRVAGKYVRPAWSPPDIIRRKNPNLPDVIPGGSPRSPMGAAALTLGDGEYAIHGTNRPSSIGRFVSLGCIRLHNSDVIDLYARAPIDTPVIVLR
jgi:lipoprotein-anchoring transpeptidase ErfK/SrfK